MPALNLLNQSYPSESPDQNSAQLINMYLEEDQSRGKYPLIALPTPGFTSAFSTINSPVRAMFSEHDILYAIGGNTFYSISSGGVATALGTLNTSTGFCKMCGIQDQILIIDGTNGYIYKINENTFVTITDVNFPNTASDCTSQDEFFTVALPSTQLWFVSAISDGTTWTTLGVPQFASTSGNNNNLVAMKSLHREIWLFCGDTTEVWYNAGNPNFPFLRRPDVFLEYGVIAKNSVAKGDSTIFALAKAPEGGPVIVRYQNYNPMVISTRAINYQLSTYSTVTDAIGFVYQQAGHVFYVLTFPTQGITWVYDSTTQSWHQRTSLVSGNTRWLANCFAYCYNKQLIGDYQSGNVYQLSLSQYTENGAAITRTLQTAPFYQEGNYVFVDKLQIDFDTGAGSSLSNVNLYVSRNLPISFGSAKAATPMQTDYGWRTYWTRLGTARQFTFKLQTNMNAAFIILGAQVIFHAGVAG